MKITRGTHAITLTISFLFLSFFSSGVQADRLQQPPTPTPTPTPKASPTVAIAPSQTLADLQDKIRQRLARDTVRRGRVGIKIVSLNTGKVVFENDADKYFMPASNMKNFTVSTAM